MIEEDGKMERNANLIRHAKTLILLAVLMILPVKVQAATICQVAMGTSNGAVIKSDGTLWMWGSNNSGQLGTGSVFDPVYTPKKIMDNVKQVECCSACTYVLKTDETLWTWGEDGATENTVEAWMKPRKIMTNVAQIATDGATCAAIRTDGSLWIWGNVIGIDSPQKVMSDVKEVTWGRGITCAAVKTDGSLWIDWLLERGGEIEFRKTMDDIAHVAVGRDHCAVIKTDGSLWMWGYGGGTANAYGELGVDLSSNDDYTYGASARNPVKVMDDVTQVSLGTHHSAAVKTDGSLWVWGDNEFGQVGCNGSSDENFSAPVKIMGDVALVCLEDNSTAALKKDGTLWMWGNNGAGHLGDGTDTNRFAPVRIIVPDTSPDPSQDKEGSKDKENETKKPPKVNSSIISGGINYKVTKLSGKTGEVTLTKPKVKKAQVVIPDTVKSNGYSFKVTGISKKAFCNNHKLKKVVLGKYVKTIGKQAFQGCSALTSVRLNSQLVTIGDSAFQSCKKMKSIVIPGKVKTIGKKAFYGDEKLASIVVKTKVLNSVGSNAIKGISKKAKISDPTGMIAPASSKSKKISLNKTSLKLVKGKSETLKIKGTSKKARWTSSNKKVATVSSKGKVTAKKKGSAKITAVIGNKKYTCKVTVR